MVTYYSSIIWQILFLCAPNILLETREITKQSQYLLLGFIVLWPPGVGVFGVKLSSEIPRDGRLINLVVMQFFTPKMGISPTLQNNCAKWAKGEGWFYLGFRNALVLPERERGSIVKTSTSKKPSMVGVQRTGAQGLFALLVSVSLCISMVLPSPLLFLPFF